MTALAAGLKTARLYPNAIPDYVDIPLAAAAKVYPGATIALNASGYGLPATATVGQVTAGVYDDSQTQDNTSGANGAITIRVRRGAFGRTNSAGNDALTQADVGRPCYVVDDNVVARTSSNGTRPFAGKVCEIAADGTVFVDVGTHLSGDAVDDVLLTVGAASLAAQQYNFVVLNSTGVVAQAVEGGPSIGVLQNAPAAGAIAIVRRRGRSTVNASGVVAVGAKVASTAAGTSKVAAALVQATGAASNVLGDAITAGAAAATHVVDVAPQGIVPTSAA